MTQVIGSSTAAGAVDNPGVSVASLEAQLVRYQKQLSECLNCDSSKTSEGKAEIQTISVRISEVRERIDKVAGIKPNNSIALPAETKPVQTDKYGTTTTSPEKQNAGPATVARSAYSTVGSQVDVLA